MIKLLEHANGNLPRTQEEKEQMIREATVHYGNFLKSVGFAYWEDPNSENTPHRVAKAWVNDLIKGSVNECPKITDFPGPDYTGMVFQGNCDVVSLCSHHNLPFVGKAHCAYIPKEKGKVIGLSKFNRIVDWFSRRPQLQEALTKQIHDFLNENVENEGVIVMIEASHSCCSNRGIGQRSLMITTQPSGLFLENKDGCKDEFYKFVDRT